MLRRLGACCAAATVSFATPALAGPPYLTNDPAPTDTGHWEIYLFAAGEGLGPAIDGDGGLDLNYGGARDVQLSATLPLHFKHEPGHWSAGSGDVELGVKYRVINDERSGFSAAIFPKVDLPTSSLAHGERARFQLPIWLEKDFGGATKIFGGGGYEINSGPGNRDFWQGGVALTHALSEGLTIGCEAAHQGPDTVGGKPSTSLGLGAVAHLAGPASLLVSGGPTWSGSETSYHFYAALGLDF